MGKHELNFARLQTLGILGYLQLVENLLQIAVHHGAQIIERQVDPVIRHAALRIVVRANLGAAVARRNHRLALRSDFVQVFLVLEIV